MEGVKILKVEVSPEAAAHVLTTAVEAGHICGLGYWCRVLKTKMVRLKGSSQEYIGAILIEDPDAEVIPNGNPEKNPHRRWVNTDHVAKAIERILQDPAGTDAAGVARSIMTEEWTDGPTSEAIVQVVAHGKVIYG